MTKKIIIKIKPESQNKRLDIFLAEKLPKYSRAEFQKMIKEKKCLINGLETKASYKIKDKDIIEINQETSKIEILPDPSIKFKIIHDEKDFAVINKPAGLVIYPGDKHKEKTLVNGILAVWPKIKDADEDPLRPGIVHRLDKDTSGIMIIAKNNKSLVFFKNLFKKHKIKKTYIALAHGIIKPNKITIDFPIQRSKKNPTKQIAIKNKQETSTAKKAITKFSVIRYLKDSNENKYTLIEASPETGRMHQIRVHLAAIEHNIVGDKTYKYKKTQKIIPLKNHFLHATKISFIYKNKKKLSFSAPLPKRQNDFLKTLQKTQE